MDLRKDQGMRGFDRVANQGGWMIWRSRQGRQGLEILLAMVTVMMMGNRPLSAQCQPDPSNFYRPIPLALNETISDRLSVSDMPTGEGGFAKDYRVQLTEGDQVAIDVQSKEFDTIVMLIADDGSTVIANDDSTEGGTSSLAFARIQETGSYIVRVKTFAATGGGTFSLKVTRLRPAP